MRRPKASTVINTKVPQHLTPCVVQGSAMHIHQWAVGDLRMPASNNPVDKLLLACIDSGPRCGEGEANESIFITLVQVASATA